MTDKQIKEDICPYQGECSINGCKRNNDDCFIKQLFEERYMAEKQIIELNKTIKTKEQENEELRQYHNKCCEENAKKLEEWLDKYNQISRDFHNGKYCNEENCNLLKNKEQELKNICKAFDIEYAIDEETGNLIGRCNKLYKKEQECNKLYIQLEADEEYHKEEENTLRKIIKNKEERNIELYKENNKLKAENDTLFRAIEEVNRINKKLDAENEELKNLLKVRIEDLCDSCGASSMMPMPCKVYEKTLIEIKEIIKQGVKIHDDIIVSKQILQKISECGVENA